MFLALHEHQVGALVIIYCLPILIRMSVVGEGTWWVTLAVLLAVFHRGPVVVRLLGCRASLGRDTRRQL